MSDKTTQNSANKLLTSITNLVSEWQQYYKDITTAYRYFGHTGKLEYFDVYKRNEHNLDMFINKSSSSLPNLKNNNEIYAIPDLSKQIRDELYLNPSKAIVTHSVKLNKIRHQTLIKSAIDMYSLALATQSNLPISLKTTQNIKTELINIVKQSTKSQDNEKSSKNTIRMMWQKNTEAKRLLEKSMIETQNLLAAWLELNTLNKLSETKIGLTDNTSPNLSNSKNNYLAKAQNEQKHWKQCQQNCDDVENKIKQLKALYEASEKAQITKNQLAQYSEVASKAIDGINQHKQVHAQLIETTYAIQTMLSTVFQNGEQAFQVLIDDILTENFPNDPIHDDTEYINNNIRYQKSLDTASLVSQKILDLAKPLNNGMYFPIEDYLGAVKKNNNSSKNNLKNCLNYQNGNCQKYQLQAALEKLISNNINMIYDPYTMNAIEQINNTKAQSPSNTYQKLDQQQNLQNGNLNTLSYQHLDQAIVQFLELDKQERYLWPLRYGTDIEAAINHFSNEPQRYESMPPIWYQLGRDPWWKNNSKGKIMLSEIDTINSLVDCSTSSQLGNGMEGLLEKSNNTKKCLISQLINAVDSEIVTRFKQKIPNNFTLTDYLLNHNGLNHFTSYINNQFNDVKNQTLTLIQNKIESGLIQNSYSNNMNNNQYSTENKSEFLCDCKIDDKLKKIETLSSKMESLK